MEEAMEQKNDTTLGAVKERVEHRMGGLFSAIAICLSYGHQGYYVAGNSCNAAPPNDFDLYPLAGDEFEFGDIKDRLESVNGYVVCQTRNALTCNISGKVVQFCNYRKPSLAELLNSFDFAHIQVGVEVEIVWAPGDPGDGGGYDTSCVIDAAYTEDWSRSHLLETTWYTGSEYPLSSLIRLNKYMQRGCYSSKHEYKVDVLRILADIIRRGYQDYQDYKDQLSAIDMMLLSEEEREAAKELYNACCSRRLVKDQSSPWDNEEEE